MRRRSALGRLASLVGAAALAPWLLPRPVRAAPQIEPLLAESDLIYLSPLRADGGLSRCQAEVWFVAEGSTVWVVTAQGAWRARSVRAGRTTAQIWVGDLGNWTKTDGRYRELPGYVAAAEFVTDATQQSTVLERFGAKYPMSWVLWGPRFRNGLADGSRVMLRYVPDVLG